MLAVKAQKEQIEREEKGEFSYSTVFYSSRTSRFPPGDFGGRINKICCWVGGRGDTEDAQGVSGLWKESTSELELQRMWFQSNDTKMCTF